MRITRLAIKNFRGIEARDVSIPPTGAVVRGGNGRGKTSILRAIRAALAAQDIGPDAIRLGADKAEILIDLDEVTVRRAITPKGSSLKITNGAGDTKAKPQAFLQELLGSSPLDPLDLFLAPAKDRRAKVLAALPVTVTEEDVERWCEGSVDGAPTWAPTDHGLDVVERFRRDLYERRTAVNRAEREAVRLANDAAAAVAELVQSAPREALSTKEASERFTLAEKELRHLQQTAEEAERAAARTAGTRERIAGLRAEADQLVRGLPTTMPTRAPLEEREEAARANIARLEAELEAARAVLAVATSDLVSFDRRQDADASARARAARLRDQADDLDAALAGSVPEAPSAEQLEAARAAVEQADVAMTKAVAAERTRVARAQAIELDTQAKRATAEAERLDRIVKRLTNEAPVELVARSNGIAGLGIDGDSVTLDGVAIDSLCGSEQLRFAVEIARRANARSRILVVDGLERLDPDQLPVFLRAATADGFQLIATRVDQGDVVIEAIEPDEGPATDRCAALAEVQ